MMTFPLWLPARYEAMAAEYRMLLQSVVTQCRELAEGNIWEPHHTEIAVECLRVVPIPKLGLYPGDVSEEDQQWFFKQRQPDWKAIRREYEEQIKALESSTL